MLDLSISTLTAVVAQAMQAAAAHPRWLNAIERAAVELVENPYITREEHGGLLIASSSSNQIYSANGVCQCVAFTHNQPCWHRAAARLVRRHDEAQAAQQLRQCPHCCADLSYADRCPAAQIAADQVAHRAAIAARQAAAQAALEELYA